MDYDHLKGRRPFPFATIAVAIAFSPRLEALLSEAARLAGIFGADLLPIHVGGRTAGKERLLDEICGRQGLTLSRMIWRKGDEIDCLLRTCKENMVDLLVLGALRRESVLRYYLGSVARGLSRRAKCSLLLLTEPAISGTAFRRIVVSCVDHAKTRFTLDTVRYFADGAGCTDIRMVRELDQTGLAMSMSDDSTTAETARVREQLLQGEEEKLRGAGCVMDAGGAAIERVVLTVGPGFAIRRYAEDCRADLLVINSPDSRLGLIDRLFTHDMEHILEHLPCNVFIVHSRPPVGTDRGTRA